MRLLTRQSCTRPTRLPRMILATLTVTAAIAIAPVPPASAVTPAAGFVVTSVSRPTNFAPGDSSGNDTYIVTATNAGTQPTDGSNVNLSATLPADLTAQSVDLYWTGAVRLGLQANSNLNFVCSSLVQCSLPAVVDPGDVLTMVVHVTVDPSASGAISESASVSGGGAPTVSSIADGTISASPAPFGIHQQTSVVGVDGAPDTQAGDHPYQMLTTIDFNTQLAFSGNNGGNGSYLAVPVEDPRDLTIDLPPGLIGNPQATPLCSQSAFFSSACPVDAAVGTVTLDGTIAAFGTFPVYDLSPPPGVAAELGFHQQNNSPVVLSASVLTGSGYRLRTTSSGIAQVGPRSISVSIWGTPADPGHDPFRGNCVDGGTSFDSAPVSTGSCPSGAPLLPFLTMPTDCSASGGSVDAASDSWQHPGVLTASSSPLPAMSGCQALTFAPSLAVAPDTTQSGAPTGLTVDLNVPQTNDPNQLATPELRDASVSLPMGMTINPSSGSGLVGCSDAQIALDSPDAASCPDGSKIGTVQLTTPLLDHALPGDVYVGTPLCSSCSPADAASGRMVRLFIQIDDPVSGVVVKLPGTVSIDQSTGQLTATFDQNPQLPFADLQVTFKSGPRAPLVNPSTCGTFTTTSDLAPWSAPDSGPDATPSSSFDIEGCGNPDTFAPSFTAGTENAQAGAYSPFVLSFQRTDSDQPFQGLSVSLPPGVTAKLAGVPLCSDSDATAGTCPASSQVGTVQTGAGAGSQPLFLPGTAYLTGPYKGAPYGLAVDVPAIAGPYNLGTVVVRQALYIDPTTAQVTAVSDPFPTILDGIPLRIRRVDVNLDRPGFMLNPTSCNPMSIGGTLTSTGGMSASMSSRFQVGGCQELGFAPKLKMSLTGKGKTKSGDHPTLTATLNQGSGQANIRSAKVALPLSMALDPNNSQHVCNYQVAQAVHGGSVACPASTIVGQATAVTPLLSQPLTGPVYLVQGIRFGAQGQPIHTLPSLLIPLRGQIALDLRAQSSVTGGKLVTTFSTIPDEPVSKFTLQITGGPKGLLVITGRGRTICGKKQVTDANFGAQSGKAMSSAVTMSKPCPAIKHKKAPKHRK